MIWEDGIGAWICGCFFVIVCGLGFAGFIYFITWTVSKMTMGSGSSAGSNAMNIARERYAKGEISREEFEQIKKDLS